MAAQLHRKRVNDLHSQTGCLFDIETCWQPFALIADEKFVDAVGNLVAHTDWTIPMTMLGGVCGQFVYHQSDGLNPGGRYLAFVSFDLDIPSQYPRQIRA